MEEIKCRMCRYFLQHYVRTEVGNYMETDCGHCIYPRVKPRKPDTLACVYFTEKKVDDVTSNAEA